MCLPNTTPIKNKIKCLHLIERRSPPRSESINSDARGIVAEPPKRRGEAEGAKVMERIARRERAQRAREAARPNKKDRKRLYFARIYPIIEGEAFVFGDGKLFAIF
jgi:hypothetical protein